MTHSVDEAIYLADRILLMSRRNGSIEHDIRIDMPRIRDRSDPTYAKLNQALLKELEQLNRLAPANEESILDSEERRA